MTQPETDEECRSRRLREMEGNNIAYYSILLQTVIESELEGIKQIIALSSVGIGLQFALDRFPSGSLLLHTAATVSIVSVIGLATAILCGIRFLLSASKRYEEELRNETQDEHGRRSLLDSRKMFARWKRASIVAFQVGVVSLAVFVATIAIGALKQSDQTPKGTTTSAPPVATQLVR